MQKGGVVTVPLPSPTKLGQVGSGTVQNRGGSPATPLSQVMSCKVRDSAEGGEVVPLPSPPCQVRSCQVKDNAEGGGSHPTPPSQSRAGEVKDCA